MDMSVTEVSSRKFFMIYRGEGNRGSIGDDSAISRLSYNVDQDALDRILGKESKMKKEKNNNEMEKANNNKKKNEDDEDEKQKQQEGVVALKYSEIYRAREGSEFYFSNPMRGSVASDGHTIYPVDEKSQTIPTVFERIEEQISQTRTTAYEIIVRRKTKTSIPSKKSSLGGRRSTLSSASNMISVNGISSFLRKSIRGMHTQPSAAAA